MISNDIPHCSQVEMCLALTYSSVTLHRQLICPCPVRLRPGNGVLMKRPRVRTIRIFLHHRCHLLPRMLLKNSSARCSKRTRTGKLAATHLLTPLREISSEISARLHTWVLFPLRCRPNRAPPAEPPRRVGRGRVPRKSFFSPLFLVCKRHFIRATLRIRPDVRRAIYGVYGSGLGKSSLTRRVCSRDLLRGCKG